MTCTFCKFEFCWICGDPATEKSEHWGPYSLTGCGAEWLDRKVDKRDLDKLRQKQISNLVCVFCCFPFIVLFYVPYLLTIAFLEQTDSKHRNWSNWLRVPIAFLTFILGIPIGVLAIPFAFVGIIFKLVHDCCYVRYCKKTPNQLAAAELIRQRTLQEAAAERESAAEYEDSLWQSSAKSFGKTKEDLENNT